jgi:hypothetical protein
MIVILSENMMTREQVIHNMCMTFRHDYGMIISQDRAKSTPAAGMTQKQREALFRQMAQIFDNDIAPYMEFKNDNTRSNDKDSSLGGLEEVLDNDV